MDVEDLACKMRLRAIKIEEEIGPNERQQHLVEQERLEALQKLYFNAGRWVGGARDRIAREAYQKIALGA